MYNKTQINKLIKLIKENDGIGDKLELAEKIKREFNLTLDRKVYYCDDFSIRFSKSETKNMSNTVLGLSALQKYDNRPFFVCIVSSNVNFLLLANTTFLKKISHSSLQLRVDNIKGSFNGSDIDKEIDGIENEPKNFEKLYEFHENFTWEENLERLVETTNNIVGTKQKFEITEKNKQNILNSVKRAKEFINSESYKDLNNDIKKRIEKVHDSIVIASAFIDNQNTRGRVIEFLITEDESIAKAEIIKCLKEKRQPITPKTKNTLGDFHKNYKNYNTETDIKTKFLWLGSCPKGYNVDKLLEFLATDKSVYMIYILGIDKEGKFFTCLCSMYDKRLIDTMHIQHHWAGRNSRGEAQFSGGSLEKIIEKEKNKTEIDENKANEYINMLCKI